ncbi:MAG: hypothetical protein LLG02_10950 [Pelosinus sp.]|nr:hypothetical protein [Pelosinus sp.]
MKLRVVVLTFVLSLTCIASSFALNLDGGREIYVTNHIMAKEINPEGTPDDVKGILGNFTVGKAKFKTLDSFTFSFGKYNVERKIIAPNGDKIASLVNINPKTTNSYTDWTYTDTWNVTFNTPGIYSYQIVVEGQMLAEFHFYVNNR